jgi:hypothetical protein
MDNDKTRNQLVKRGKLYSKKKLAYRIKPDKYRDLLAEFIDRKHRNINSLN